MKGICSIALAAITLLSAGCISYHTERGIVSSDLSDPSLIDAVVPGATGADWLSTRLGEPTRIVEDGAATIWTYHRTAESSTRVRALPLLAVSVRKQTHTTYHFEIEEGVVQRYWIAD